MLQIVALVIPGTPYNPEYWERDMGKNALVVYTDGSCVGTDGGWSAILTKCKEKLHISGNEKNTTSNRMELTAVIKALEVAPPKCTVFVYSDSLYVVNGINSKLLKWLVTTNEDEHSAINKIKVKMIKNIDLWRQLFKTAGDRKVAAAWIKGHSGIPLNEVVNSGAQACSRACR